MTDVRITHPLIPYAKDSTKRECAIAVCLILDKGYRLGRVGAFMVMSPPKEAEDD